MTSFVFLQNSNCNESPIISDIYRLRHEVFVERLQWDIQSENGYEMDRFDDLQPYYIAISSDGGLKGSWRALPTLGSYMLKDVFPELLQGEVAPNSESVWEISRLAARKGVSFSRDQDFSGSMTLAFIQSLKEFANQHSVESYVTVTTLSCERLMKQFGIKYRRFGEGKVMNIGIERTVALWIDADNLPNITTC